MIALGIDVGYGYTKAVSSAGRNMTFPSAVGRAEQNGFRLGVATRERATLQGGVLHVQGTWYWYGEQAQRHARVALQPRDRGWIQSLPYRVLWHAVVDSLVPAGAAPWLVTGLPVRFYGDRETLKQMVSEVLGVRQIAGANVTVVPQPFGSFFDHILNAEGQVVDDRQARQQMGIIDVGHYTTDLITVSDLDFVQKESGSLEVGVATVLDTLRQAIYDRWGRTLDMTECARVLHTGQVRISGTTQDVRPLCIDAQAEAAAAIVAYTHQLWGGGEAFDELLITGGGGVVFCESLRAEFSQARLTSSSFLANARGFLRYALYKARAV